MIDFQKELEKFDFFKLDAQIAGHENEATQVIDACHTTLQRIGKDINQTSLQIEDAVEQLLEENEKDKHIAELNKAITAHEEEKITLVQGLVSTLDQIEDAYRYAIKNEGSSWAEQLRLLWENIFNTLLLQGISRIEGENTLFDLRVHSAVQVKEDKRYKNGLVLEVLRCGYTYKSRLLRKAQVVVNKIDRGEHAEQ
jgi:molecular chaperone GrpE (heat shock protein)